MTATSGQQPPPMKETDPAVTEASQGHPDKAILSVTLDELEGRARLQICVKHACGSPPICSLQAPTRP